MKTLREFVWFGLALGVLGIGMGIYFLIAPADPNATPTCNHRPMSPGDLCIVQRTTGTVTESYDDMKNKPGGRGRAAVLLLVGVVITGGASYGLYRTRP
ncbi:hypothetical protein [Kribbella sp.]|uniref:hypothetical protein n=1 Tax=Kribbella sp. TaxID=1871183 RepID=UPI002D34E2FA|nr:hypothetical protein [Kribbella sp.]HZX08392.1 hypothetical protein [Kribbella sp.]